MSKSWASTLRLPKSSFPPRPASDLRPLYFQRCTDAFYQWQDANRPVDNTFILHDGPPYANGNLHVGHGLNKVLKDMIVRVNVQQGRRANYIPGWDCHGLPIELKALGASGGKDMSAVEIRKAARKLASKTVVEQMKAFRSYAVMADWDKRWTTMDLAYEMRQLRLFQKLVQKGLIYRKFKPVYWSPSSRTALAEAELEYNENHISTSAYIAFYVTRPQTGPLAELGSEYDLSAVIWTTTPWTLPANRCIAVHQDLEYMVIGVGSKALIVAKSCLEAVQQVCFEDLDLDVKILIPSILGKDLVGLTYRSVLRGSAGPEQPFIHADFVSADSGSGLVHCAPGHGFDDYEVSKAMDIPVAAPVDNEGCFTAEAFPNNPEALLGIPVLEGGSDAVLKLIEDDVLGVHKYKHKYPYDWRTKKPIIIRATAQWFADVASIKEDAVASLQDVRFIPETGSNRLESFVKGRSEWCISRQRAWGVPIPALYDSKGDAVMTEETVAHIIKVIGEKGTDAWWRDDAASPDWIPEALRGKGEYRRGTETMDVWFDSGSSWTMLEQKQADVYLEGSDQHRGWFQSSLLTRVASLEGQEGVKPSDMSPFKNLITHGFTLDGEGKKMSKSLGNIISPAQVMDGTLLPPVKPKKKKANSPVTYEALGPDALRLWVASSDYRRDIVISESVLKSVHAALIRYRTIIKMLLGSMHQSARTAPLTAVDNIAIVQLKDTMAEVGAAYTNYEFYRGFSSLNRWITNDLSAFYLEALKDRLYCADGGGVLEPIFMGFMRMLAPVTPMLVEEAWDHAPAWLKEDCSTVHPLHQLYTAPLIESGRLTFDEGKLREAIPVLLSAHGAIKSASELARLDKVMGSSLQCSVILDVPSEHAELLTRHADELEAMFVVSSVEVNAPVPAEAEWKYSETFDVAGTQCTAWVLPPKEAKCPRCWRYVAPKEDHLCQRCEDVVTEASS